MFHLKKSYMNLLHLHYFYVVAKEGGFTKAARTLFIQQSAISRMVGQLEDSFGFPLFERIGRNVQLTTRGCEVFERSKKIFSEVDSLRNTISHLKCEPKGHLYFGAAEPIASHLFPEICEKILPIFPNLHPNVFSGPSSILLEKIKCGELEFGLFFYVPELPAGLKMRTLKIIRFYVVVRKDLRSKKSVLESFIGSREIDDRSTKNFPTLEKIKKFHPNAKITISSNNLTAHRSLVLRGCGISVLPEFLIHKDLKEGKLVDLFPKEMLHFDLRLVERETSVSNPNADIFLSALI